jgi:hypothetical protein
MPLPTQPLSTADSILNFLRTVKGIFDPNSPDSVTLVPICSKPAPQSSNLNLSQLFDRCVNPVSPEDIAVSNRDADALLFPRGSGRLLSLGPTSKQRATQMVNQIKASSVVQIVLLATIAVVITGLYKILTLDISLRCLMSGLCLVGLLCLSIRPQIRDYGLKTGDLVYAAFIFGFDISVQAWRNGERNDRLPIHIACVSTTLIYSMLKQDDVKANNLSCMALQAAFLLFLVKAECTFLEILFQMFLFVSLAIQRGEEFSIRTYFGSYLTRYNEVFRSNATFRSIILQNIRETICAIQLQS